jgi:hypothetical protein
MKLPDLAEHETAVLVIGWTWLLLDLLGIGALLWWQGAFQ